MKLTANHVTIGRILLLPVPCILLIYGSEAWVWASFGLLVLVGATDFVDGMMARRDGPTPLGGLLDPAADKIFIAATALTLGAMQVLPWWVPIAILSREFLLTVLRTSVALHRESVKTSLLGKMKTIIQMGGFGTIFLTAFLPIEAICAVSLGIFGTLMAVYGYWWATRHRWPPFWILPVALSFVYWLLLCVFLSVEDAILGQLIVIVGITWFSAIDYVVHSYRIFRQHGLSRADFVRIAWALVHSVGVVGIASVNPQIVLPVILGISCELGVGAIDNIVAAQASYAGTRPFIMTSLLAIIFFASFDLMTASVFLACASAASLMATSYRWRHLWRNASPTLAG